jgi:hypothetical protein
MSLHCVLVHIQLSSGHPALQQLRIRRLVPGTVLGLLVVPAVMMTRLGSVPELLDQAEETNVCLKLCSSKPRVCSSARALESASPTHKQILEREEREGGLSSCVSLDACQKHSAPLSFGRGCNSTGECDNEGPLFHQL